MSRVKYFAESALHAIDSERGRCPNCGGDGVVIERKYVVTSLKRCGRCQLQYRSPTDNAAESERFYNDEYEQGVTTALPDLDELESLKRDLFPDQDNSYSYFIDVLRSLGTLPRDRLFDFGCSWGYGSYQLQQAGFDVTAFEISRTRGAFARSKLGVNVVADFDGFVASDANTFDVFFSSHVLEHVPSPSKVIRDGFNLLKPGGLFVSFFPNCSESWRETDPGSWSGLWGKVHPNALDEVYLNREFSAYPRVLGSSPVEISDAERHALSSESPAALLANTLVTSSELMIAARKF